VSFLSSSKAALPGGLRCFVRLRERLELAREEFYWAPASQSDTRGLLARLLGRKAATAKRD
jgi:hypothetical protein